MWVLWTCWQSWVTRGCPRDATHKVAEQVWPCPSWKPLQGHPGPEAAEVPQSPGETVPAGIGLREVDAERDVGVSQQEAEHFPHTAVLSLVAG